ncbi:MAG: hypothetical protein AB1585_14260 [Thermodesulfobacteriota bacterium]
MIIFFQFIGIFLALGNFVGILMFWNTVHFLSIGVPLSLLIMSLAPCFKKSIFTILALIALTFGVLSYAFLGIPFLDKQDDVVARLLHFTGLLLILIFIIYLLIIYKRERRERSLV